MKVNKEIKLFHPAYGWMMLYKIEYNYTYPTIMKCGRIFSASAKDEISDTLPSLAFNDYTKGELPQWATLDEIKKRLEPQHPVEGKLYKCWDNNQIEGTYSVVICVSHNERMFRNKMDFGRTWANFEPIEGIDYND